MSPLPRLRTPRDAAVMVPMYTRTRWSMLAPMWNHIDPVIVFSPVSRAKRPVSMFIPLNWAELAILSTSATNWETSTWIDLHFTLRIFRGPALHASTNESRRVEPGRGLLEFVCSIPSESPAGYGAELTLDFPDGKSATLTTAFDVLADWTFFPRYGFVCDFSAGRPDPEQTVLSLACYHINGLQFYDWQYRHDDLLPPVDDYLDPLNRPQSLNSTRRLIAAAHARGMAAMPYLAVYAASADFWRGHPQWMLYDADHKPIPFGENFLGIMNPVDGGPWQRHLLDECRKVLAELPFNGLHIDQYGEPKSGEDADGRPVDIASAFGDFVRAAAVQHPGLPVLFNAVGNWPIETLAASPTTFNYIEIPRP